MVLVIGGTGRCGGAVARALVRNRYPVRVLTRSRRQPRARDLEDEGIEIVEGDLLAPHSFRDALEDVDRAFLVSSSQQGLSQEVNAGAHFLSAARERRLRHVVFQSVLYAETSIPHCATKGAIERLVREAGIPFTIFRPGYFMDSLAAYLLPVSNTGELWSFVRCATPIGWIDVDDIASAVVSTFRRGPDDRTYDLVSPAYLSFADVARIISEELGRKIPCVHHRLTVREFSATLEKFGGLDAAARQALLDAFPDPDADYYEVASEGLISGDPRPAIEELDLRLSSPEGRLRGLVREILGGGGLARQGGVHS